MCVFSDETMNVSDERMYDDRPPLKIYSTITVTDRNDM